MIFITLIFSKLEKIVTDDGWFSISIQKTCLKYCILAGRKSLKYEGNDIQAHGSGDLSEVQTAPPCA